MKRVKILLAVGVIAAFLISGLSVMLSSTENYNGLKINPSNRKYFLYQDNPIYLIGAIANYNQNLYGELNQYGVNEFGATVFPVAMRTYYTSKSSPYYYCCGEQAPCGSCTGYNHGVEDNWNGWNAGFWQDLRQRANTVSALNNDSMLFVLVFSTCQRKTFVNPAKKDTWDDHLWNSANGGPINNASGGVDDFYELYQYGTAIFDFTNDAHIESTGWGNYTWAQAQSFGWKWQSQYRQEQLLAKLDKELPPDQYPNIGIILQWEIDVGWVHNKAEEWTNHMVKYIKDMRNKHVQNSLRPVGIGSHFHDKLTAVNDWDSTYGHGDGVFGLIEGNNVRVDGIDNLGSNYPIIYKGYHPREECYYGTGDECNCVGYDVESQNVTDSKLTMRDTILRGYNLSMPFDYIWCALGSAQYCDNRCNGSDCYDLSFVKYKLLDCINDIVVPRLDQVFTWNDEPEDELAVLFGNNVIRVRYPDGGETLTIGDTVDITWLSGVNIDDIKITLFAGGAKVGTIMINVDSTSFSYSWIVGQYYDDNAVLHTASPGSEYKIKIVGSGVADMSDAYFTMVGQ